jgi:predicted DNA-binding transcriptional regulator YafY
MSQIFRIFKIDRMLHSSHHVSRQSFLDALEIELPTLKRDLRLMRLFLNANIIYDRNLNAYRLVKQDGFGPRYELPYSWLTPSEAYALLTAHSLLESLEPRLLGPRLEPLKQRLVSLIAVDNLKADDIRERIQVIPSLRRMTSLKVFDAIAQATLKGCRLKLQFTDPLTREMVNREQSPQRLTYYRENWFLDAWCHDQEALRNIAIDAIKHAEVLDDAALSLPKDEVDAVLNNGYGTVIGLEQQLVVLDFSPERTDYLSRFTWYGEVKSTVLDNGWCRVEFAYNNDQELMRDILCHGSDVIVQAPEGLRQRVKEVLAQTSSNYL